MKTLGKGCFGSFGTHYGYFHYLLWEKQSWLTTNLSYDQPSGTNWVRKPRAHCIQLSTTHTIILYNYLIVVRDYCWAKCFDSLLSHLQAVETQGYLQSNEIALDWILFLFYCILLSARSSTSLTAVLRLEEFFPPPPDRPWGPPSLYYTEYRVTPKSKAAGTWRWPRPYLAPRLRKE
jgi:hypothetical protein